MATWERTNEACGRRLFGCGGLGRGTHFRAGARAGRPDRLRQSRGRDLRQRPRSPVGPRLPARRPPARDREAAAACASSARTGKLSQPLQGVPKVFASGQGGLLDVVLDRGVRDQFHDLFLLRRSGRRRRPHQHGAGTACDRGRAAAGRRQDHLPAAGAAFERQSLGLPHRADAGRQPLPHARRSLHLSRRGAEPRQSHRQDRPHQAGRLGAA